MSASPFLFVVYKKNKFSRKVVHLSIIKHNIRMKKISLLFLSFLSGIGLCRAQSYTPISLPSMFADHMVLQQNASASVWGWGTASSTVKIVGGWAEKDTISTKVDCFGQWKASLPTGKSGGPYTLQVFDGTSKIVLNDVLLGEVWLCSGQSNMEWTPDNGLTDKEREVADADCPDIRIFHAPKRASRSLQEDCFGQWDVCTSEIMRKRSSVAYFFARHLRDSLQVPVGIMVAAWGGTPAEVWTPADVIAGNPNLRLNQYNQSAPWWPIEPGVLYNQMLHPLLSFTFAGAIWYQGETNRENPEYYGLLMKNMIESWRREAGRSFPFYQVQIAPFLYKSKDNGPALIREAQEWVTRHTEETGLAVISDYVEDLSTIHPINKRPVGKRLADLALAKKYKTLNGVHESPFLRQCEVKEDKLILTFSSAQNGLVCRDKEVKGMEIAGPDGVFVKAKVAINNKNQLVISSPEVKTPVSARYCFDDATVGNLFNKEGYPVAPFRTDRPAF